MVYSIHYDISFESKKLYQSIYQ